MSTEELMSEAVSLPVDIRLKLVERLLQSLNPSQKEIDEMWATEAERRVREIESGEVKTVPGDKVFSKISDRLKE
ncbi:MAG: addiction module protein [Proteobacteria bacterium]|nr:addiction module protein [Pseudomonadota bacterium]